MQLTLLAITLVFSCWSFTEGSNGNTFSCGEGQSFPRFLVCDGVPDCVDETDEDITTCQHCAETDYICNDGTCVRQENVCDGHWWECEYGEDEGLDACGSLPGEATTATNFTTGTNGDDVSSTKSVTVERIDENVNMTDSKTTESEPIYGTYRSTHDGDNVRTSLSVTKETTPPNNAYLYPPSVLVNFLPSCMVSYVFFYM